MFCDLFPNVERAPSKKQRTLNLAALNVESKAAQVQAEAEA